MAAAIVHYVMGSIKLSGPRRTGSVAAQAQLSILLGLAVLVKGVGYWFDQYGLEISNSPTNLITGIGYTADNATVTAKMILAVSAGICALLFFANAVLRRWIVPTIGLILLVLSAIVLGPDLSRRRAVLQRQARRAGQGTRLHRAKHRGDPGGVRGGRGGGHQLLGHHSRDRGPAAGRRRGTARESG